jgi:hypothetical protein
LPDVSVVSTALVASLVSVLAEGLVPIAAELLSCPVFVSGTAVSGCFDVACGSDDAGVLAGLCSVVVAAEVAVVTVGETEILVGVIR